MSIKVISSSYYRKAREEFEGKMYLKNAQCAMLPDVTLSSFGTMLHECYEEQISAGMGRLLRPANEFHAAREII